MWTGICFLINFESMTKEDHQYHNIPIWVKYFVVYSVKHFL